MEILSPPQYTPSHILQAFGTQFNFHHRATVAELVLRHLFTGATVLPFDSKDKVTAWPL